MTADPTDSDPRRVWLIDVTYVQPLDVVDQFRDAHLAVLDQFADAGVVAASGPRTPRIGGVIVTHPVTRRMVDDLIEADPFHRHRVATFIVTALESRSVPNHLGWVSRYERAWRAASTDAAAALFTADASYSRAPFDEPLRGVAAIRRFFEAEREGPDESLAMSVELVASSGATAVTRVDVAYASSPPRTYRSLWVITLDANGRCSAFEEWSFLPGLPRAARLPSSRGNP